jgi:hypothetical protein
MRVLPAILTAVAVGVTAAAQAQPAGAIAVPFDILNVLKVAYYPVQVMAYCNREVQQNPTFQTAGTEWLKRNQDLLTRIEAKAKAENVSNALRVEADKQTLETITKTVASQSDGIAYCKLIAQVIDGGQFDLHVRDDLKEPLKRIFPQ